MTLRSSIVDLVVKIKSSVLIRRSSVFCQPSYPSLRFSLSRGFLTASFCIVVAFRADYHLPGCLLESSWLFRLARWHGTPRNRCRSSDSISENCLAQRRKHDNSRSIFKPSLRIFSDEYACIKSLTGAALAFTTLPDKAEIKLASAIAPPD